MGSTGHTDEWVTYDKKHLISIAQDMMQAKGDAELLMRSYTC